MRKQIFRVIQWLFVLSLIITAQSLSELMPRLGENNMELNSRFWRQKQSEAQWASQKGLLWPTLSFQAQYNYVSEVLNVSFQPVPTAPAVGFSLGQHDAYKTALTVGYALFNGFKIQSAIDAAYLKSKLAATEYARAYKEQALKAATLYRRIQEMNLRKKIVNAALKRLTIHGRILHALIQQGLARKVDSLDIRLKRLQLKQKTVQLDNTQKQLQRALDRLFGFHVTVAPFEESLPVTAPEWQEKQVEAWQALDWQERLMAKQKEIEKASYWPRITAGASYIYGKPGVDVIRNEWMDYYVAGVNLSWDIWSGMKNRHAVEAADYGQKALALQKKALSEAWHQRFEDKKDAWQTLKSDLTVRKEQVALNREKWRLLKAEVEQGRARPSELEEASLNLTEAELNLAALKIAVKTEYNEMEFLSGKPVADWRLK